MTSIRGNLGQIKVFILGIFPKTLVWFQIGILRILGGGSGVLPTYRVGSSKDQGFGYAFKYSIFNPIPG